MGVSDLSEARRAVFFDRDGTLNRAYLRAGVSHPPVSPDQLEILPRVSEATRRLKDAGFVLVCVSNQPDVARGVLTRGTADGINTAVREMLCLDALVCCFHDDGDGCDCRKPRPGMLVQAAHELGLNLPESFMVGDSWRDVGAGGAAGCTTIQVRGLGEGKRPEYLPDYEVEDVSAAADVILQLEGS